MHTSFLKNRTGSAAMEFALIMPFMVFLLIGGLEVARFIIINQKLEATASTMADLATQGSNASKTGLKQIAAAANIMMDPYSATTSIIFSSVSGSCTTRGKPGRGGRRQQPCIVWQYKAQGTDNSQIGSTGSAPTLPGGYTVLPTQNVIVAETFYHYTPYFTTTGTLIPSLANRTLYYPALYKPRQGSLTTLN